MKNVIRTSVIIVLALMVSTTSELNAQEEVDSKMYSKEVKGVMLKAEALAELNAGAYKALSVSKDNKITAGKGYKMLRAKDGSVLVTRGNEFQTSATKKSGNGWVYFFCTGCGRGSQPCELLTKFGKFVGGPRGGAYYYTCSGCLEDGAVVPCAITLLFGATSISSTF